ncbi:hypothetical protein GOODEAATRI_010696, partial [Goodea atripinnis]
AEIRRLQEANKAARKERQLLLKQQEEIERMRNSTLRLKERLKCAEGEAPPETPVSEPSGTELSSLRLPVETRSPSPSLSISGSETSSIMQKLKKMRSQMDEKQCSPVHYFFSVFTAHHWASLSVCLPNLHPKFQLFIYNQLVRFLTKREQQLMQRRHHAEELLQWKQQLDQEEAEVRRMEKEALAAWDQRRPQDKDHKTSASDEKDISETGSQTSHHQSLEPRSDSEKENISDRSDIESRIKELREELRKRKIMAYQLKKEQKKRHQERLKAQEANLLKQLEHKGEDLKFDNKTEFSSQEPASPTFILDEMPSFHLGDRVLVGGVQPGTLRFKGPTSFANGFWAGVELDKCEGSNNGTYDGVVYFECEESHGIFAPPDKVSHLLGKFELYADNTEDEDSFFDDLSDKGEAKHKTVKDSSRKREDPEIKSEQTSDKETKSRDEKVLDESDQIPIKTKPNLNSQHQKEPEHRICNGNMKDIILDLNDASNTFLIPDEDRLEEKNEETTAVIGRKDFDVMLDLIPKDQTTEIKNNKREQEERDLLDTFADKLLNNFIKDSFKKCAEIKRVKEEKIRNANQSNGCLIVGNDNWISSLKQKDNLPFFLPAEKEELSSPELCNRSVSVFLILV